MRRRAHSLGPATRTRSTLPAPSGLRAGHLRAGPDHLLVLSFPVPTPRLPESLTDAEREVAKAIVQGLSNAEIAAARGSSVRTVANQVASLLRKLGVHSRVEVAVALCAGDSRPASPSS